MDEKHSFRISLYGLKQYCRLIYWTKKDNGEDDLEAARALALNFIRLIRFYTPKGDYCLTERTYLYQLYADEVCPLIDLNIRGVKLDYDITETSKYEDWIRLNHPEVAERWKDYDLAP